ncbi:response regulator transcription factor [Taibaiella koreensis]|uniref:response regulator transcription factor n=1 Tax=Taibaiella koreensis TaxID=1268548 RepID=UPI000E5A0961|nr:response regulator transcription factor [Taibaiella koreensis]
MQRILMIEADEKIAKLVGARLEADGCSLDYASGAVAGLVLAHERHYDLIVLDMELTDMPAAEALVQLKREKTGTPMLILVVHQEEIIPDPTGLCDYLLKPFSMSSFLIRVKALMKSAALQQEAPGPVPDVIVRGALRLDGPNRQVTLNGALLELGYKEFDLLQVLMAHPGRTFAAESLLKEVWGLGFTGFEHTLTSALSHLRARIEPDPLHPRYILTTWGVGYRFTEDY